MKKLKGFNVYNPQAYKDLLKTATNKKGKRFSDAQDAFVIPNYAKVL